MLAPISWRTPPRHYGPCEQVTSLLTEALVARGVDVTLFATKDSRTAAKLDAICPAPYSEDPAIDAKVWEMLHVAHVFEQAGEFDLIHNQADFVPLAFSRLVATPMVTTIHGFSSEEFSVFKAYDGHVHYVAISQADRHPDLRYAATIHHGIPLGTLRSAWQRRSALLRPYSSGQGHSRIDHGGTSIWTETDHGRHRPGPELSQRASPARTGQPVVVYLGPVGGAAGAKTLGSARALLHLINFDEPFGLSVVEALACGTPVIACNRGSMRELIDDGVTGFLVDSLDAAVAAINRIGEIDRAACRAAVSARFTVDRMADRYLDLYRSILG